VAPDSGDGEMTLRSRQDINQRIDRGVKRAVAKALEEHKRAGRSIVVWKEGKVVSIPPEEITVPSPEDLREDVEAVNESGRGTSESAG